MSAIHSIGVNPAQIHQNAVVGNGASATAKKVALFALSALIVLANVLLLPFKWALLVSLAGIALLASCLNSRPSPPASVLPNPVPIARIVPPPVMVDPFPRETLAPIRVTRLPIAVPTATPPIRTDFRPRETVGDGHINLAVPAPTIVPVRDPRPRETVGDGHINANPIIPPHREPVVDRPINRQPLKTVRRPTAVQCAPPSTEPIREAVGGGHYTRPDTPRPSVQTAPLREPVGRRNPK